MSNRIKGRKSAYLKSLDTPFWQNIKRLIRMRDNYACQICGSSHNWNVHHITYYVDGKSIRGSEDLYLNWLILLCRDCHSQVHADIRHVLNPKNWSKIDSEEFKKLKYERT